LPAEEGVVMPLGAWDLALLAAAGYIVVMSFTRLMRAHRDRLVGEINEQIEQARREAAARETRPAPRNRAA
jgi:hypothetical protein